MMPQYAEQGLLPALPKEQRKPWLEGLLAALGREQDGQHADVSFCFFSPCQVGYFFLAHHGNL